MKIIKNEKDMSDYGKKIAGHLTGGDILCLTGELGTGKTTLTKGLAIGLGVKEDILSPTFTLMNVFTIKNSRTKIRRLVHIDTYRLKNRQELMDIGALDYLGAPDTVCVIEWPEKIKGLLKGKTVKKIRLEHRDGGRKIQKSIK